MAKLIALMLLIGFIAFFTATTTVAKEEPHTNVVETSVTVVDVL